MDKNEKYKSTFQYAVSLRTPHESDIREAYKLTQPAREFGKREGTTVDRSKLFDSTATYSVRQLVNHVVELLVPQNRAWARIELKTKKLKEQLESALAERLLEWNDGLNHHFLKSNFYLTLTEAMYDSVIAGTGCIAVYDVVGKPLSYIAVPIDQIYFTQNHNGAIDYVFRKHELTGRQMMTRFMATLPADVLQRCEEAPEKPISIVECVAPKGPFFEYCIYVEQSWDCIAEQESNFNPFIVWRWERTLAETWGTSPVRDALPDIRSLNIMERDALEAGNFAAKPCYQTNGDGFNVDQKIEPGNLLYTEQAITPLQISSSFPITLQMIQDRRARLLDMLYATTLGQNPVKNTYMTAEEVAWRRQLFYTQAGGPARRLENELLRPLVEQVTGRLMTRGELEQMSERQVQDFNIPNVRNVGDLFVVETNAAIFRALKQSEAQNDLQAAAQIANVIMQAAGPDAVRIVSKIINIPELIRNAAEGFSLSPDIIYSRKQTKTLLEQEAQQQQALAEAQQQQEAMKQQAKGGNDAQ
jgi:hypothetical protein